MNFFIQFFKIILYQPFLNILILFYIYLPGHDFGVAIILLTLIIKLLLFPVSRKAVKSQKQIAELQPKIKKIKEKYKYDKQQQAQAMMRLYQDGNISPASGCLPLLLQMPILIALYQVFLRGLTPEALRDSLYSFVPYPGQISTAFLGFFDLSRPFWYTVNETTQYYWPCLALALMTGLAQFVQMRLTIQGSQAGPQTKTNNNSQFASLMQSQMMYFMPFLIVFIVVKFGSILGLYLLVSILFSIGEHYFIAKNETIRT